MSLPEPEKRVLPSNCSPQLMNCSFCHKNPSSNASSSQPWCPSELPWSLGVRNGSEGTQGMGKRLFLPWHLHDPQEAQTALAGDVWVWNSFVIPWGQATTFLLLEHSKDSWPCFIILIYFRDADQIHFSCCEWRGCLWQYQHWMQWLPKMGCGRGASWQGNSCGMLKRNYEVEMLVLSSSLALQGCHSAHLCATRWNRQCISNLINNLMSQIPPARWKRVRLSGSFLNQHLKLF